MTAEPPALHKRVASIDGKQLPYIDDEIFTSIFA
jgi:hypothetical protein